MIWTKLDMSCYETMKCAIFVSSVVLAILTYGINENEKKSISNSKKKIRQAEERYIVHNPNPLHLTFFLAGTTCEILPVVTWSRIKIVKSHNHQGIDRLRQLLSTFDFSVINKGQCHASPRPPAQGFSKFLRLNQRHNSLRNRTSSYLNIYVRKSLKVLWFNKINNF